MSLFDLVTRVKSHLSLLHVRLATPDSWTDEYEVATVAVCAGSGAKVLHGARADVYLTGKCLDQYYWCGCTVSHNCRRDGTS